MAPDGRGYGDTEKPTGIDEYTIDKLATDVKNLVNGKQAGILFTCAHAHAHAQKQI